MARNLCVQYSTRPEVVEMFARISAAGVVLAPVSAPGILVAHTPGTGVYVLTVQDVFAEFLGASGSVESAVIPASAAAIANLQTSWNNALRQLTVTIFNSAATPAPIDAQFAIDMAWADSRVA